MFDILNDTIAARNDRHSGSTHGILGIGLVTHRLDHLGLGADELNARGFTNFGKLYVFRQEAITGVDCFGTRDFRGTHNLRDIEIAL